MVLFYNSNKPRFTHSGSKFNNNNKKKISLFWLLVNIKYIPIFKYFWLLLFFFGLLGESLQTHTHTHSQKDPFESKPAFFSPHGLLISQTHNGFDQQMKEI